MENTETDVTTEATNQDPWDHKEPMDRTELPEWMTDSPVDHSADELGEALKAAGFTEATEEDFRGFLKDMLGDILPGFKTSGHTLKEDCPACAKEDKDATPKDTEESSQPFFSVEELSLINTALSIVATDAIGDMFGPDPRKRLGASSAALLIAELGIKVTQLRADMQSGKTSGVHRAEF